jgi:hypothetical protein
MCNIHGTGIALERAVQRRFILALPLILLAPLQAATLERLSLDDMIEKSTAIVRGRISGSYAAYSGSAILTHYRVQVSERWKGANDASVEFVVPGGKVQNVRQVCPGAPELVEGKEYILFLWTSRSGLTYIIGFTQGLFELPKDGSNNPLAVRAASSEAMLEPGTGRAVRAESIQMPVRDLGDRISRNLSRGATK